MSEFAASVVILVGLISILVLGLIPIYYFGSWLQDRFLTHFQKKQKAKTKKKVHGTEDEEGESDGEQDRSLTHFQKKQKAKSKKKVHEVQKNEEKDTIVKQCKYLMGPIVKVGGFASSTKVQKSEGIRGRESFNRIVDNIGQQLNLADIHIAGIKEAANADSQQYEISEFKGGMIQNGSMILHTGSYCVERKDGATEDEVRFDFEIAMSVIKITEVEFVRLGDAAGAAREAISRSWFQSSSPSVSYEEGNQDLGPDDWETYFVYTANKKLLEDIC